MRAQALVPTALGLIACSNDMAGPAFNPALIAFATARDGNEEIYVMNADGSSPTLLLNDAADDLNPAWSPDGKKIAFATGRDGNDEIYVMNADGSGPTLASGGFANRGSPVRSRHAPLFASRGWPQLTTAAFEPRWDRAVLGVFGCL